MLILIWIISGIIGSWLTGLIVRGRGFGLLGDLIIGLLGLRPPAGLARFCPPLPEAWCWSLWSAPYDGPEEADSPRAIRALTQWPAHRGHRATLPGRWRWRIHHSGCRTISLGAKDSATPRLTSETSGHDEVAHTRRDGV